MSKTSIAIVGGGTAGWMAANLLAKRWANHVEITVIESPNIGIIGVGEGSTPALKQFFETLAIPDEQWMPACHATYKTNITFAGWSPSSGICRYGHPFVSQTDTLVERAFYVNCLTRRLGLSVNTQPEQFFLNGWLADAKLAPIAPANFPFDMAYGYHFDSALLGQFLQRHALSLGAHYKAAEVADVQLKVDGRIDSLRFNDGQRFKADLYIDCTGLSSKLLQQALQVPFQSFSDNLFNDAAVVAPTAALDPCPVETMATAATAGWFWQIPLQHRTGNGYVYSSSFLSADAAETEFRQKLGLLDADITCRHLAFKTGQVKYHWHKNCLALGLAQGFIEPLEATALHLVQGAVELFIDLFQQGQFSTHYQAKYNTIISERFAGVRDYIVGHYQLNTIQDKGYWAENRHNPHISANLQHILRVWRQGGDLMALFNTQRNASHFGNASWHCLLAGYGEFKPLAAKQPLEQHDMFILNNLTRFFNGCLLNFAKPQSRFL
ncbi:MAG: tryptophan 7-halogenase [Paraglaciecola sp.]|nr:tryptophan 7-halogenase [Paraglaciecola sp.]